MKAGLLRGPTTARQTMGMADPDGEAGGKGAPRSSQCEATTGTDRGYLSP